MTYTDRLKNLLVRIRETDDWFMQYIEVCEQGETPEERLERLEVTLEKKEAINKVIARILRIK